MHFHDHQGGVVAGRRVLGSTQIRCLSRHEPIGFCETVDAGKSLTIDLPRLKRIASIVLEARLTSDASQVHPDVYATLGGREIALIKGPFQWSEGGHWDSPFGEEVTELTVHNNADEPVIIRGSILPEDLSDDADEAAAVSEPDNDDSPELAAAAA